MTDLFFTAVAVGWIASALYWVARYIPGPHCKNDPDEEKEQ